VSTIEGQIERDMKVIEELNASLKNYNEKETEKLFLK
jgi:hypothetical protein